MLFWCIILLPLLGAFLNGLVLRNASKTVSHFVGSAVMVASFICALFTYINFWSDGANPTIFYAFDWLKAGSFNAPFQFILDQLSGLMMLVVTGIGSLIHIYAGGYMHEEKNTWRFFCYLNLFVFMMLLLVFAENLPVMFIGWEGVGLCSYLLIGYWYEDDNNAAAGMKAFLVNRIGDIAFLLGIFLTFKYFHTVSFGELKDIIFSDTPLSPEYMEAIGWITLCFFGGACGKSAQLPLYVWLPDAMAGPTPVSALIHAATMVTAGIYMMTRLSFLYFLAPDTQFIVSVVGSATALFAATIALVQTDIKKVLAYSTVSQLGYMILACGLGAYDAGVFHLFTHACFKALLFLGAGSVIVAMHHKQDMREMGGLKKYMPITYLTMLVGVLAIIGFPGLAGFFSKDEILLKAWLGGHPVVWGMAALAAVCTAFYMVRLLLLTFHGENRSDHHTREHLHETGPVMWAPLVVLAVLSAVVGYLNVPHAIPFPAHLAFSHYLEPIITMPESAKQFWGFHFEEVSHSLEWALMGVSTLGMVLGSGLAILWYRNGIASAAQSLGQRFQGVYRTLLNKYWVDEAYDAIFVNPLKEVSTFLWKIFDVVIVDGIVNGVGQAIMLIGGVSSFKMSGSLHRYGMMVVVGLLCMLASVLF